MKKSFISLFFACISVIILSGFVFFAGWSVSPTNHYFANVPFGDTRTAQFTLENDGPYSGAGAVSISGSDPQYFSCISGCAYSLDSGEDQTVTIKFTAPSCYDGQTTNYGATIEFPHNGVVTYGWIAASVSGSAPRC